MSTAAPNELAIDMRHYDAAYYLNADGQPQPTFDFQPRTLGRAQAIVEAVGLPPGNSILDYGCGLGNMTAAFNRLGYAAIGVDPSPYAIAHMVPGAQGLVRQLGSDGLAAYTDGQFELALAKDVFEHVPIDDIPGVSAELLRVADRLIAVIPTTRPDGTFIFGLYENDPTHVTRLTGSQWLALLAEQCGTVQELPELPPKIRRAGKVAGTVCALVTRR